MPIDWSFIDKLDDAGKEMISVIKPYLPALAREGPDVFEGFIKHFTDQDWAKIDQLMYAKMTVEERRELEDDVYKGALAAAKAKYRRQALFKEIAFKVGLRLILILAVG